jgi:taurine dioxygenase
MIQVRPLGSQIGAEVSGVDVKALDDTSFAVIYRAWLDYNIVVVPGRHPDFPEISMLGVNKFHATGQLNLAIYRRGAEGWHTDGAYDPVPFKATQLYAAYEALPEQLKRRLDGLNGAFSYGGRKKSTTLLNEENRDWTPALHPIIRTHPETGRKALYFDPGKIPRIVGLEEHESEAVIEELTQCMIQPEAQYRHRWTKGEVVIWDNRCSYHLAAGDYPPEEDRIHWRMSIHEHGYA